MEYRMNVLSLFDGMSCGRIALERAGIEICEYFASEIDPYAIKVSKANYPQIKHIGSVTDVKAENLPQIDLLIGGSPCQGFSFAGKQLNFEDPRSKLFFEYVRLLKECRPKYFLLENVVMKKEFQDVISKELGVEPILINSALVSAQNRKRLYWSNILGIKQPEDKGIQFTDILSEGFGINTEKQGKVNLGKTNKSCCLMARDYKGFGNQRMSGVQMQDGTIRKMTPLEYERLQTVPDNYTAHVSNSQRYKMLGNGWTVDIIAHILKQIKTIHT